MHIKIRQRNEEPVPAKITEDGEMTVLPVLLDCIQEISSVRIMLPDDLTSRQNKLIVKETFKEVLISFFSYINYIFQFIIPRFKNNFKIIYHCSILLST